MKKMKQLVEQLRSSYGKLTIMLYKTDGGECIKIIKCLTICFILGLIDNCLLGLYYIINIYWKYIDKGENVLWEKRKEILQMDY